MSESSFRISKRDTFLILVILLLAIFFRALYLKDYQNTDIYPLLQYSDSYSYFLWAKDIASGDFLSSKAFMKWPLYAYFVGFWFKFFQENVISIYLFQFTLGALNCILIYFIAKIIFNERVAFLTALLYVCYGLFIFYDGLLIYNSLSLFLNSLLFLYILHIRDHPNKKNLFCAGILLGICTITQASILLFGILAVAWVLGKKNSRFVYNFSFFIVALFLIIGAVTLMNYLAEKDIVFIAGNTGFNFYSGNNPEADGRFYCPANIALNQEGMFRDARVIAEAATGKSLKTSEVSSFWFNKSAEFIKRSPLNYAQLLLKKIAYLFSPQEPIHEIEFNYIRDRIGIFKILLLDLGFILPFAFLGMFLNIKRLKDTGLLYILLFTVSLSIILFFVTTRYRMVMVPFLIIFAASALSSLLDWVKQRQYLKFSLLVMLLFLLFILFNYRTFFKNRPVGMQDNFYNLNYHLERSGYYYHKSDYPAALKEAELALKLKPDDHYAALSIGSIYYNMGDLEMAQNSFKEAIKIFPLSVDAYYNLGILYNRQQRFKEAQEVLERALSLDIEDIGAHFELGRAYKAQGKSKEAKKEFTLALNKINRWRIQERSAIQKELADLVK